MNTSQRSLPLVLSKNTVEERSEVPTCLACRHMHAVVKRRVPSGMPFRRSSCEIGQSEDVRPDAAGVEMGHQMSEWSVASFTHFKTHSEVMRESPVFGFLGLAGPSFHPF